MLLQINWRTWPGVNDNNYFVTAHSSHLTLKKENLHHTCLYNRSVSAVLLYRTRYTPSCVVMLTAVFMRGIPGKCTECHYRPLVLVQKYCRTLARHSLSYT